MTTSVASAVRPGLRDNRTTSSPHTPTRFTSIGSNFSSPGSTYRQEEDAIIVELGSRYLRAGFEGDSGPQCVIPFNKESSRRVGDFRAYAPDYRPNPASFEAWAKENELWRNDLGDVDLGLVEDKLERTIREVYNKYLLVDAGKARLVLVLPSLFPHPLLERVLTLLFDRWNYSTIALLPSPTMSAAAAGLRSGLVVDVGWEEIIATPIYEYRELRVARTSRGMKLLIEKATIALTDFARKDTKLEKGLPLDHDFVEEVVMRIATCEPETTEFSPAAQLSAQTATLSMSEAAQSQEPTTGVPTTTLEWPIGTSSKRANLPLSLIQTCIHTTLLSPYPTLTPLDDNEQTLPSLVYHALLSLSPDVRGLCMSRIIFVGGGSHIPGLPNKILAEVQSLIETHGWSAVRGGNVTAQRPRQQPRADARHDVLPQPEVKDYVEASLRKQWSKHAPPEQISGVLRRVDSLGAWAGASLLTSLKVKGFVEVEREKFMSQGLAGASRDGEGSVVPQQRGSTLGLVGVGAKGVAGQGWTLGGWG